MRSRYALLIGFLVVLVASSAPTRAQAAYQPEFDVDVVSAPGDAGDTRVDVYTAVPRRNLRFLARTDGFEATYSVTVDVYGVDAFGVQEGLVVSRAFERSVRVETYDETLDRDQEDRSIQTIELAPGTYAVQVAVEDGASGRTFSRELARVVRAPRNGVAASDPILLDRYDPAERTSEPNVSGVISTESETFVVYYEIVSDAPATLEATYMMTERNRVQERPSFAAMLGLAPRQQAELGTPVVRTEMLEVPAGRTPAAFRVPTKALQVGDYTLAVRLATADGLTVAESEKPVAVRWMGLESQIADIDEAIAQLRFVAKDREVRAIRQAATPEEKLRLFRAFWDERDPTPGTTRNERMEEYYYRVAFANERYSRFQNQGWNSDRGEVFIRFGEPDYVEEHPYNYGSEPYQVWTYYRNGRRFIFVDEDGVGDYRLLVPIWDERTRL